MSSMKRLLLGVLPALVLGACAEDRGSEAKEAAASTAAQESAPTPIDQLYSLPAIAGTTPEAAAWSPDGSALAFAWNDQGFAFRDVWLHSVDAAGNVRLTRHSDGREPDS